MEEKTEVPQANPAPLGLAGFGLTTIVLSAINSGVISGTTPELVSAVVPLAFAYGGVGQVIAGVLEYKNGNTFGTVAFTSYGLFWWWYAFLMWTVGAGWIKPPAGNVVGLSLLVWGVFTLLMWISTFRLNLCLWFIFLLLWLTFFALALADLGFGAYWRVAGGWLGLLTGAGAMYLSFAEVTNATFRKQRLPLGKPLVS